MSDLTIVGGEELLESGRHMMKAAQTFQSSVGMLDSAISAQMEFMSGWMDRFEAAIERLEKYGDRFVVGGNVDSVVGSGGEPRSGEGAGTHRGQAGLPEDGGAGHPVSNHSPEGANLPTEPTEPVA